MKTRNKMAMVPRYSHIEPVEPIPLIDDDQWKSVSVTHAVFTPAKKKIKNVQATSQNEIILPPSKSNS